MMKPVRCAIYTRKSSEEGLAQDFNSLDAQREACEAYIKSQMHEGWILVDKQYNDGGYSGGTMERPAFKELLKDIGNDEIDIVVVYKVDRLTRSLMDFSKIIDVFDKHETSFVSITQQFNTTTSMGRLTLNILLSFAQFEREVTGERIRDKIAASKKKGMWMGGKVPLGYSKEDKKLVVHNEDAQKLLYENKVDKTCGTKCSSISLLAGLIFDDKKSLMTPSHSNSHKRRYRYYVSTALKNYNDNEVGTISKIPAGEIEKFVVETTKEFLQDKGQIQKLVKDFKISKQNKLIYTAQNIEDYSDPKLIRAIIYKIVISKNLIEITLNENSLINVLNALSNNQKFVIPDKSEKFNPITITKKIKITQSAKNNNILILNAKEYDTPEPNPYLVNAIVKSHYYHKQIQAGRTIENLQSAEGFKGSKYIRNILNLKYIFPDLTEQIFIGTQPKDLSLQRLVLMK